MLLKLSQVIALLESAFVIQLRYILAHRPPLVTYLGCRHVSRIPFVRLSSLGTA